MQSKAFQVNLGTNNKKVYRTLHQTSLRMVATRSGREIETEPTQLTEISNRVFIKRGPQPTSQIEG
ncbi:hypothetical protein M378DRAFT_611429 [Amanita muscaria Koide BX008]|uniref:Uncharacterized protein n=1 Tax=Amanita muscaria (strain Koide BX008) TaxID=946122 RepID=A0A0C2XM66_AMAMK|nr:hypothetical protein M378DRAFT_611429 [Amanita muscaria Koide BX008]